MAITQPPCFSGTLQLLVDTDWPGLHLIDGLYRNSARDLAPRWITCLIFVGPSSDLSISAKVTVALKKKMMEITQNKQANNQSNKQNDSNDIETPT